MNRQKQLKAWAQEFVKANPNGTKPQFRKFVREKEAEAIEAKFNEYVNKSIKQIEFKPE